MYDSLIYCIGLYRKFKNKKRPISRGKVYAGESISSGKKEVKKIIKKASEVTGVPYLTLVKIAKAESNLNPQAKNNNSSAKGLFQFTDGTWRFVTRIYARKHGIKNPDVLSAEHNAIMAGEWFSDIAKELEKVLGRKPTTGELYIAHFSGLSGAKKALTHDKSAPAHEVWSWKAINANKEIFFHKGRVKTVGQVISTLKRKIS